MFDGFPLAHAHTLSLKTSGARCGGREGYEVVEVFASSLVLGPSMDTIPSEATSVAQADRGLESLWR
jgi:hypothetical protein